MPIVFFLRLPKCIRRPAVSHELKEPKRLRSEHPKYFSVAAEDRNFEKRIGQNETTSLQWNFIILLERHTKERKKCSDLFFLESEWLKQVKANFSRELFWLLCSEQSNRKTAIRRLLQNGKLFINQLVHSLANRSGNRNNQLASVK